MSCEYSDLSAALYDFLSASTLDYLVVIAKTYII